MRKPSTSSLTTSLTILVAIVVAVVLLMALPAFAQPSTTQSTAGAQLQNPPPGTILSQAAAATMNVQNATGNVDVSATVSGNLSTMSSSIQALLSQPIDLSGTYAFNGNPKELRAMMTLAIAGQNIPVGLETVGNQAWVQFMGQWYQASDIPLNGNTGTSMMQAGMDSLVQALATSNINFRSWLTNVTVVGQETLAGTSVYHLRGTVDTDKILEDVFSFLNNADLQQWWSGAPMMPTKQDLQSAEDIANAWINSLTVDMWVADDTHVFRQFQVNADIVPPAGQLPGIDGIIGTVTLSIDPTTSPTTITPPENPQPFSQLETLINSLMNFFSGGSGQTGSGTIGTTSSTGQ